MTSGASFFKRVRLAWRILADKPVAYRQSWSGFYLTPNTFSGNSISNCTITYPKGI